MVLNKIVMNYSLSIMLNDLQEKVVFVTCEDDDKVAEIQKLNGKFVRLELLRLYLALLSFCV